MLFPVEHDFVFEYKDMLCVFLPGKVDIRPSVCPSVCLFHTHTKLGYLSVQLVTVFLLLQISIMLFDAQGSSSPISLLYMRVLVFDFILCLL